MPNYVSEPARGFNPPVHARIARSCDEPNHNAFLRNWLFIAAGFALAFMLSSSLGMCPAEA
jgi:hypothetical protein